MRFANKGLLNNNPETVCSPTETENHGALPEPGENEFIIK